MTHYRHTQVGWLMLGIVAIVVAITVSMVLRSDFAAALSFTTIAAALCALFGTMTVTLDEAQLTLWFGVGLIRKHIRFAEIRAYQVVRNPWYYGWGIRWFPGGWLYNISGFSAVELLLHNGRRIRVGTDEPDTLFAELQRVVGSRPPLTTAEVEAGRRRARLSVIVAVVLALALILAAQCFARRIKMGSYPIYFPSTENASSTFPGIPPAVGYPELNKTIPPAMAGPGPSSDPPCPGTPLTVS